MSRVLLASLSALVLGACAIDTSGLAGGGGGGTDAGDGMRDGSGPTPFDSGPDSDDAGDRDGGPLPTDDAGPGVDACRPVAEACNLADDDCDGTVDEGTFGVCGMGVGECVPGDVVCVDGAPTCMGEVTPAAELCNDRDDDCDGTTDEGNPEGGATCGVSDVGACALGTMTCVSSVVVCQGDVGPTTESCNAADDDCDATIDETGCPCDRRTFGGHIYLFCDSSASWTSARDTCAARGYHLVTIEDSSENDFIEREADAIRSTSHWWIGLNDRGSGMEGMFVWVAGTGSYRNWNGGEPDDFLGEDCVALAPSDGEWTDRDCAGSYRYVCEYP